MLAVNIRVHILGPIVALLTLSTLASAEEVKYLPCNVGPQALRQVDEGEQKGLVANFRSSVGAPISPEVAAEHLIADCSQQLAVLSAAAALDPNSPTQAIVNVWQTNLDFMKWWLQNRRSKVRAK